MRAGSQWRHLHQLGRAFTASHYPSASSEANLVIPDFVSWSKLVEQLCKSSTIVVQGMDQENYTDIGDDLHRSSIREHARHFSSMPDQEFGGQSTVSSSNSGYAGPISRKLYSFNPRQDWKLRYKLTPGRTQVSNASSREPACWDHIPETRTPSQPGHEGVRGEADQNRVPRAKEWHHDEDELGLTRNRKVRKETGDSKMARDDDGVEWGQQHVRIREFETGQWARLSANPPPKFQKDDVYIPVKACYISRSVDLKRLSEEPFLEITTSRNNLITRFANRPADAKPTSNRPGFSEISRSQERYMVAFQYGSIVFFNFGDDEEEEAISAVRKFCTDEFRETRKDDYGVLVRPTLPEWSEGGKDRIMLRMLDTAISELSLASLVKVLPSITMPRRWMRW